MLELCETRMLDEDEPVKGPCELPDDPCPLAPGGALKVLLFITPAIVILNIHFAFVLYTHWKNSSLPKEQGGCNSNDGPAPDEFVDEE